MELYKNEVLSEFWFYPTAFIKGSLDSRWNQGNFTDDGYSYVEMISGSLTIRQHQKELTVLPGESILIDSKNTFYQEYSENSILRSVKFFAFCKNGTKIMHGPLPVIIKNNARNRVFFKSLDRIFQSLPKSFNLTAGWNSQELLTIPNFFEILGHSYLWFSKLILAANDQGIKPYIKNISDSRISEIIQEMENNFFNKKPKDSVLANKLGLDAATFRKIFHAETSVSPIQYYNKVRLSYAKQELLKSSNSIKRIQHSLGFTSAPSFTGWFKKHAFMTPTQYLQIQKGINKD